VATLEDVRRWDPAALEAAFKDLGTGRDRLLGADGDLAAARPAQADWQGVAADRARTAHDALAERLRRTVAGATALRAVVADAADAVTALRTDLARADALAAAGAFGIGADGTVTDLDTTPVAPAQLLAHRDARIRARDEIVGILRGVLDRAAGIDAALRDTLGQATSEHVDDGDVATLAAAAVTATGTGRGPGGPPVKGTPQQNADWWRGLSGAERERLVLEHPDRIGSLDGVPATVRDEANRARIPAVRAALAAQLAVAQAHLDATHLPPGTVDVWQIKVDQLHNSQAALDAIATTIDKPGRQLLLLDVTGHAQPRAAVAVGDIDTARHVAVFTPGLTTTVAKDIGGYTSDMTGVVASANRQLDRANRHGEPVAAVAWLGYDAPQLDPSIANPPKSVLTPWDAASGGHDLARFYDGINASRGPDHPHLTALGHSYGSTTTGYALQNTTTPVDDAVVFGSPGLGTNDAGNLHVPAGRVNVIEAHGDPVADLAAFGGDPNRSVSGVHGLSSHDATAPDGTALRASHGHSEYLIPGTTSQYNIAATVAGLPADQVSGNDIDAGDVARAGLLGPFGGIY
jgi:Alpha/beta hydrolase